MIWDKLTSPQIEAFDKTKPVILNIAAIEQHGPHLPLDTDARIAALFLEQLDSLTPQAQLILPQVKVCCSDHHLDFAGTLSVPHTVLMDYVCAILESVVTAGFYNLLILNSHGGNLAIGQVIVEHFGNRHPNCQVALVTWWRLVHDELIKLSQSGRFGTGHACELETSLMMAAGAIASDAEIPQGTFSEPSYEWSDGSMLHPPKASLFRTMKEISGGNGIVGKPDAASPEKGEIISTMVVRALAKVVADLTGKPD